MNNKELCQSIQYILWGKGKAPKTEGLYDELKAHAIDSLAAPALSLLDIQGDQLKEWKKRVFFQVIQYEAYLKAQQELPITVPYVILKGTAAGQYYPHPEYRSVGDIDVMTNYEDYEKACRQLLENHFTEVTSKDDLERKRHREFAKNGVSVEIHLFFASMNDPIKTEKFDRLIIDNINETHILSHAVNGMVLLEHINQHLEGGLGLRQIIDWMMFVDKELSDEKWPEFKTMASETGLEKLAVTVTKMCELNLGLKPHNWSSTADERLCQELLSYILSCGNFGQKRGYDEELALGRAAKLRHPILMIKELQQMGIKNWGKAKNPILKHFAWVWQGYRMVRSTSGLFQQMCANIRLSKMLDDLEVRRADKGLVYYENGQYIKNGLKR